jgi:hypothetical protein
VGVKYRFVAIALRCDYLYYESDKRLHTPKTKSNAAIIMRALRDNIQSLIHGIQTHESSCGFESQQQKLENALNTFWCEVDSGRLQVESTALLRAMYSITCSELPTHLSDSHYDGNRVIKNLKLFLNTVEHVLKPT